MNFRSDLSIIRSYLASDRNLGRIPFLAAVLCIIVTGSRAAAPAPGSNAPSRPEEEIHLRYRIDEEIPRGTVVGNVIDDAGLRSRYSNAAMQQIRFRFLAESSSPAGGAPAPPASVGGGGGASGGGAPSIAPAGLFEIGASSGVIRTASELDRDSPTLCRQRRICELSIDVVTHPVQYFRIIKVTVEIVDVNDNAPRFRDSQIVLSINEAAQPGSLYPLPTAVDWDSPDQNGVQRYEIDSPSPSGDRFSLHVGKKLDGSAEVKLHLRDRLDRETTAEYRLRLVAFDGGSKSGATTLIITVADSNDNRPEFIASSGGSPSGTGNVPYEFTVVENLPVGSIVGRVQATDRDAGANGLVTYEIVTPSGGGSSAAVGHGGRSSQSSVASSSSLPFIVRNATGEIVVRGTIDRESAAIYRFVVVARDNGPDPLSAEASVVIHVEDLNDNAPTVTIHTLETSSSGSGSSAMSGSSVVVAEVSEDSPVGSFVAYVSAVDPDDGSNGRVDCELVHIGGGGGGGAGDASSSSSTFALIQKYENEYQIVTAGELDRERRPEYMVAVRCRDNGSPSARIGEKSVRIVVTDVNDNPPVFSQQTYKGSIVENNFIGVSVLQVTASDWDAGDNGRIQYSIPGTVGQMFHVDQQGVISIHAVVDREKYDSFRFPILAVDRSTAPNPPLTGSALVIINVEDVDDERPRFLQPHYVFGVYENEPEGTEFGSVLAEDRDGVPFNDFRYGFQSGDTSAEESFSVDATSGAISLRLPLDRERRPQYRFVVVAYDPKSYLSQSALASSTATVTVNVLDRNDNAPRFVSPPENSTTTVQVSAHAPISHVISTVSARDADIDDNGRVTYSLRAAATNGNDAGEGNANRGAIPAAVGSGMFRIDPTSGAIVVDGNLLPLSGGTFPLVIVATDGGIPPLSASTAISVCVNRSLPFPASFSGSSDTMLSASSYGHNARMTTFNLVVVVAIVCGCSIVVFILIVAIALVRHRDFRRRHARKYNCRMEALRMITSGDGSGKDGLAPETATTIGISAPTPCVTPKRRTSNGSLDVSCIPEVPSSIRHLTGEPSGSVGYHSSSSVNEQANHGSITPGKFGTGNGNVSADSGADQDSIHSVEGDGSVTDSGRGPSEEGEAANTSASATSSAGIGISGGYTNSSGAQRPQRERYLPPPPPPPRLGAYWALHHQHPQHHQQQQPQQPAVLVGGHYSHHHRGPPQSHPTVRFHGLSTTIPEDEMLGDCCQTVDDGVMMPSNHSASSLSLSSVTSSGRPARQTGRRAAAAAAAATAAATMTSGGNRANYVGRLPGQRSARVYNTCSDGEVCGGSESDVHTLLLGRKATPVQSECDARSLRGSGELSPASRQSNGSTSSAIGAKSDTAAGWPYRDNSVIV